MLHKLKRRLYFIVAAYFVFWARFVLRRWQPRVVVITGSSGKTTTLHMVEAQLGDTAVYSHHANGAFGIPFHILGMAPNVPSLWHWPLYVMKAPFKLFRRLPASKLYIVEADCDRPHEGEVLAKLLKPEVTLWVSVYHTHSMNFDRLVRSGQFKDHEAAIGHEFGNFAAQTTNLVLAADQPIITTELSRLAPGVSSRQYNDQKLSKYVLKEDKTTYRLAGQTYGLPGLHPKEAVVMIQMVAGLLDYLQAPLDPTFAKLVMPPGRLSVFKGKKQTWLIDSTYNTGLEAAKVILQVFQDYQHQPKWLVFGDILEQGSLEQSEHEQLAELLVAVKPDHVVLLGPRTKQYTLPKLQQLAPQLPVNNFERPDEVLAYLNEQLKGGEALLFKGGRFLEGVIEQLLADPADAAQLVRREAHWQKTRQAWGLPS